MLCQVWVKWVCQYHIIVWLVKQLYVKTYDYLLAATLICKNRANLNWHQICKGGRRGVRDPLGGLYYSILPLYIFKYLQLKRHVLYFNHNYDLLKIFGYYLDLKRDVTVIQVQSEACTFNLHVTLQASLIPY